MNHDLVERLQKHHAEYIAFLRKNRMQTADAEDIMQEAYTRALRTKHTPAPEKEKNWMYAVVRNKLFEYTGAKSYKQRNVVMDPNNVLQMDARETTHDLRFNPILSDTWAAHLRHATTHQREIIYRRLVLEQTFPEIASDLDANIVSCRVAYMRGIARIKDRSKP